MSFFEWFLELHWFWKLCILLGIGGLIKNICIIINNLVIRNSKGVKTETIKDEEVEDEKE
jgi:hypothetical protein